MPGRQVAENNFHYVWPIPSSGERSEDTRGFLFFKITKVSFCVREKGGCPRLFDTFQPRLWRGLLCLRRRSTAPLELRSLRAAGFPRRGKLIWLNANWISHYFNYFIVCATQCKSDGGRCSEMREKDYVGGGGWVHDGIDCPVAMDYVT